MESRYAILALVSILYIGNCFINCIYRDTTHQPPAKGDVYGAILGTIIALWCSLSVIWG